MYWSLEPPEAPAGSRPVAPPADVCEELCEVPSALSKSQGSAATNAATSPSCSSSSALAALTLRAPAALSANYTCSSAICRLSAAISAFSASVAFVVLAALATLPSSSAICASLALSAAW